LEEDSGQELKPEIAVLQTTPLSVKKSTSPQCFPTFMFFIKVVFFMSSNYDVLIPFSKH
jgi:hypothetical protein